MANARLTLRDIDLLSALDRTPLTVRQIRALSVTFVSRFGSDRRLQDRLSTLTRAGLLHRFRYASTEGSGQFYYTLSPESYRLLHGTDAVLPSGGMFKEVGIARQHHTHRLADFIVRTQIAAAQIGVTLADFVRENQLKLTAGIDSLCPDCCFTLALPNRPPFLFYAELDNSTEPLASPRERDSWVRKLRIYEALQDASPTRFRVLGLVTRSEKRLTNIVALAASVAKNPQRSLFYGVYLPDYLRDPTPLTTSLFSDHRGMRVPLVATEKPKPATAPEPPAPDTRALAWLPAV
jgi:hypothetical protein